MKTCKGLLLKAREDEKDPVQAILDWRNTPSEGFGTSPGQRLMGRCIHISLPTSTQLLQPCCDPGATARELAASKRLQCRQHNQGTQNLSPLQAGDLMHMRLPGEQKWSLGHCTHSLG